MSEPKITISPKTRVGELPEWFNESGIIEVFDTSAVINSGCSPMNEILNKTNALKPGEIFELHTPFIPVPIIDMMFLDLFHSEKPSCKKLYLQVTHVCLPINNIPGFQGMSGSFLWISK